MNKNDSTVRHGASPFGTRSLHPHKNGRPVVKHHEEMQGPPPWYSMKTRPKHLPKQKQQELAGIVKTICTYHKVEMVILFGSYARGDWVEDQYEEDGITYEYRSDYDILIVTADKSNERDVEHDNAMKEALEPASDGTRVNYIVHTIQHINQMLAERRFFFMDILKDGFMLMDSKRFMLARPPKELEPDTMLRISTEYFSDWIESGDRRFRGAQFQISDGGLKDAAFDLHQATERYLTCLLLIETGYRPKKHDTEQLLKQATGFDIEFNAVFPRNTQQEERLFDLLRRAYIDARYSKAYKISEEELNILSNRVQQLKEIVERVCKKKLEELQKSCQ
jgi:uncharacterized protein